MSDETYRFKVGDFACIAVLDHRREGQLDGIFTNVPEYELERAARALHYDPAAVPLTYTPFAINTGEQWVLVDTGNPQTASGQAIPGRLLENLRSEGVAPEEVRTIIITHCHGDHIGGLTDADGNLVYPNARYFMLKDEWGFWMDDDFLASVEKEYADFLRSKLLPIQDRLTLLDDETEIMSGISVVPLPGHTPGHAGVRLQSAGEQLLNIADTAHVLVQLAHPQWSPRFDRQPELAATTRRELFERAARDRLLLMGFHLPFPGLGRVIAEGSAFAWQPVDQ